jgi:hypothetical protein
VCVEVGRKVVGRDTAYNIGWTGVGIRSRDVVETAKEKREWMANRRKRVERERTERRWWKAGRRRERMSQGVADRQIMDGTEKNKRRSGEYW